jgi:hypothetical protein
LLIGWNPARFRPMMIASALEKLSFAVAAVALYAQARLPTVILAAGTMDLALGTMFLIAWWRLGALPGT